MIRTGAFASDIRKITVGNTDIGKVYVGSSLVWTKPIPILPAVSGISFPNGRGRTTMDIQTTVSENNGGTILEMGVVYSTTNDTPTTADSKFTRSVQTGTVMIYVTGLTPATYYYWRVFARNANGTAYYPTTGFGYNTSA